MSESKFETMEIKIPDLQSSSIKKNFPTGFGDLSEVNQEKLVREYLQKYISKKDLYKGIIIERALHSKCVDPNEISFTVKITRKTIPKLKSIRTIRCL